jgi:predicted nucleic acid-binding protein
MLQSAIDLFDGFLTWQTPLSFMAGVGFHHLYAKYLRDRKGRSRMMFTRNRDDDGEYRLTNRFWVIVAVAAVIVGYIGWRTQQTADQVQDQTQRTEQFAKQTNDCLNQVVGTLKDRTNLNASLDDLVNRRTQIWTNLVVGLAAIDPDMRQPERDVAAKLVLQHFFEANGAIDRERADLLRQRADKPYPEPNCGQEMP